MLNQSHAAEDVLCQQKQSLCGLEVTGWLSAGQSRIMAFSAENMLEYDRLHRNGPYWGLGSVDITADGTQVQDCNSLVQRALGSVDITADGTRVQDCNTLVREVERSSYCRPAGVFRV